MKRRYFLSLGAALISAAALITPGKVFAETPKDGGTLIMIVQPEPPTLASYISTSGPIGQVTTKVYDGLLEYDFDLQPKPGLAESWEESADGKTITFKLRPGVKFHNGTPLTSADVEFSIMKVLKEVHARGGNTFKDLEAIETPDELTAVFKLKKPAPYMIRALSGYESPILSKALFEGKDVRENPTANAPISTGPFKFVEWKKGQYVRLDKNENYWKKGLPHLDRIVARFIADAATRTAAIEKGEAQYAAFSAVPNIDAKRLAKTDTVSITTKGYTMINPLALLEINTKVPPFDNAKVRQAISYAIDRQFIIDNIFYGFGKPATGSISSTFAPVGLYSDKVRDYQASDRVAKANALLDEAGFPKKADGTRFELNNDLIPYGESWQRLGDYFKQAMGDIGVKVNLRYEDVPTWLKRIYSNYDYQVNANFFYQLADPVLGMHRQYLSDQIRPGIVFANGSQYNNPEIDALMEKGATEPDPKARSEIYDKIQTILAEDVPVIPLFEMDFVTVYNNAVKDSIVSPLGVYSSFDQVWLDK